MYYTPIYIAYVFFVLHNLKKLVESVASNSRMVNSCCTFNCSTIDTKVSREAGIKFYRFRKEPKRTPWLNAIKY